MKKTETEYMNNLNNELPHKKTQTSHQENF